MQTALIHVLAIDVNVTKMRRWLVVNVHQRKKSVYLIRAQKTMEDAASSVNVLQVVQLLFVSASNTQLCMRASVYLSATKISAFLDIITVERTIVWTDARDFVVCENRLIQTIVPTLSVTQAMGAKQQPQSRKQPRQQHQPRQNPQQRKQP